jgi:hypothetical protein
MARQDLLGTPDGVEIRVAGPDDADSFAKLWADGFEVVGDDRTAALNIRKGWFSLPDIYLYVASVDGAPAGIAALYLHDGVGYLNVGATLPAYRMRGIHMALVSRRVGDAMHEGCDVVMANTSGFATSSQNHMEHAGMTIAFTRITMVDRAS